MNYGTLRGFAQESVQSVFPSQHTLSAPELAVQADVATAMVMAVMAGEHSNDFHRLRLD